MFGPCPCWSLVWNAMLYQSVIYQESSGFSLSNFKQPSHFLLSNLVWGAVTVNAIFQYGIVLIQQFLVQHCRYCRPGWWFSSKSCVCHPVIVNCVSHIFPYNNIEDDDLLVFDINHLCFNRKNLDLISERIFDPFEMNTDKYYAPLCDIDPDINFFNEIDNHLVSPCNYFMENHFISAVKNRFLGVSLCDIFSLCYMNIRQKSKDKFICFWIMYEYLGNWIICYWYVWNLASPL